MEEMTLRVPVAVKAKVTEDLKAKIVSDLETRLDMVNKDLEAIEFQAQRILADAAKVDATSLTAIRQQIDEEKNKRLAFKEEVTAKLKDAQGLALGTEIPQGTLEQTVTVKIGDDLDAMMGAEILLEDGKIVALAKDGSVVLDVKDSKAKAKTAYVIVTDGTEMQTADTVNFGETTSVKDPGFNSYADGDKVDADVWSGADNDA